MRSIDPRDRRLLVACAVNATLAAMAGALAGGVRGAQVGLVLGLVLGTLPTLARSVAAVLARPHSLPRLLAGSLAAALTSGAATLVASVRRMADAVLGPARRLLRGPALAGRFCLDVLGAEAGRALGAAWRQMATPLGLANLSALAVLAIDLAGLDFAGPALFAGLTTILVVLLVSASEARDAAELRA
ncbi:hypothetical protein [Reyranella sp.]|uniref:hypothetical protein n=1 Tax=Reyranella sp. TaxID=1929291 RepID=UPI003BABEABC